jgi:hypothetical protein
MHLSTMTSVMTRLVQDIADDKDPVALASRVMAPPANLGPTSSPN